MGATEKRASNILFSLFLQREPVLPILGPINHRNHRAKPFFRLAATYKILYNQPNDRFQPVEFRGTALDDLRAFPEAARREAGHQLNQVQYGREPDDWKPMTTVGRGVQEIRIRDASGAFRVLYVAKFDDAGYAAMFPEKDTEDEQGGSEPSRAALPRFVEELGR
jgi:phage-related protein